MCHRGALLATLLVAGSAGADEPGPGGSQDKNADGMIIAMRPGDESVAPKDSTAEGRLGRGLSANFFGSQALANENPPSLRTRFDAAMSYDLSMPLSTKRR